MVVQHVRHATRVIIAIAALCSFDCNRPAAPPPSAAQGRQPHALPTHPFVAVAAWQSKREGVPPVEPPDLSKETWRVLLSQNDPIQRKTPLWQSLPATETVLLAMPEGSSYRCLVTPLQIESQTNGFQTKLKAWLLSRSLMCSGDDWRSWTEYPYRVRLLADGTRETPKDEIGALLRERHSNGQIIHTFALFRSDAEQRAATTGPPQILTNVQVAPDDD